MNKCDCSTHTRDSGRTLFFASPCTRRGRLQRRKFDRSLKVDERLSRLEPRNPLVFYNLACSYSLNDELELAAAALEKALALGYRDFKWLARDPDLRKLRKHPRFRRIRDKIRKIKVEVL